MDNDPHIGALGGKGGASDPYRSIIHAVPDGIFVIDRDGKIIFVNDALAAFIGRERTELVDSTFEILVESELVARTEYDRFRASIERMAEGGVQAERLTFRVDRADGRVLDVHLSHHSRDDGTETIVGVVRDETERKRRITAAERKQAVLAELYEVGADASLTFEDKIHRILASGCEYLDLPYGFLTRVDDDEQQMVHTVGDHELLQPGESAPIEKSYCRNTIESDGLVGMHDARAELGNADPAYQLFELGCYIGSKVLVGGDLYGTFCFAAPQDRDREFTTGEREVIKLLGQWAGYELERQRFEERLQGLHEISQRLLVAETTEDVAEVTVEMGAELFDLPVTACWEYDTEADVLRPVAQTDEAKRTVGDAPTFARGDALVWESFESGEIRRYDDLTARSGTHNPETLLGSEVHVPCENHGIITSAATEPGAFDEIDLESLRLLGALVTEAMTAVKREERLVERGEALQRQNDRLEEFAHLVAHDLRNPLAGAMGSLDVARRSGDEEFFDRAEESLQRMDDLIDELLAIARGDRQEVTLRTQSLTATVEEAWSHTDAPSATLSIDGPLGEIRADETRLLQLFGNLFRNSVEHCPAEVTVTVGRLSDDDGFYVGDDGPGLTAETQQSVREYGADGQLTGTGIGLQSILDVVAAHDWQLSVPDTDTGARFEIRTGGQRE